MGNSPLRTASTTAATRVGHDPMPPPAQGFSPLAPLVCILTLAFVAVRIQEFLPLIGLFKPVLLVSIGGFAYLLATTASPVIRAMLRERQTRLVLAYFAFALLTMPFALYTGLVFRTARGVLPAILLFLGFMLVAPTRRILNRLQVGFVVLVLVYAGYTKMLGRVWGGRLHSVSGLYDGNDMASVMAIAFPLAAGLVLRGSGSRDRLLGAIAAITFVLVVVGSGSRGGALALLAGAIVFALGLKGQRGMIGLLALAVGLALAWATAPNSFRSRMLSLTELENDYNYTHDTGRKAVWARARGYIKSNPVLGVGMGNFPIAEGGAWEEMDRRGKWSQAHNAYLQAWVELGVFGGSLLVLILLAAAKQALPFWRARPRGRAPPPPHQPEFLASLAAFAVGAYFLSHAYFPPMFGLVGLIALADRVRRMESASLETTTAVVLDHPRLRGQRGGLAGRAYVPPLRRLQRGGA
jgi:O-antigen ligase